MTKSIVCACAAASLLLHPARASDVGRGAPSLAFLSSFRVHRRGIFRPASCPLPSTAVDDVPFDAPIDAADAEEGDPESILMARDRLVALASTLASNSPSGRFLTRPADKREMQKAVQKLEAMAPATGERERDLMVGDWTLVATANVPSSDIRRRLDDRRKQKEEDGTKARGWFNGGKKRSGLSEGKTLNTIQKSIQKTIEVTQRIRADGSTDEADGQINRVDNVIEYTPLDTLEDIIPEESPLYNLLGTLNVNPLQVKKSKVVLVHKAEVESVSPVLSTKIAWTSSVLNVAGSSQYLSPEGEDVFGLNNLFGEFVNVGTFDTPFVDGDVRVSRTSGPVFEQLRVFVRQESTLLDNGEGSTMDSLAAELRVEEEKAVTQSEGESMGARVKKVADTATSLAENARDVIEKDMDDVTKALGDKMDDVVYRVQDAVEDDLKQIGEAVEGVQSAMRGEGGDVGGAIADVTKAVARVPGDVRDIVEEDGAELEGELREALDAVVADVQDSVEEDLKGVGQSIEEIRDAVADGDEGIEDGEKEE